MELTHRFTVPAGVEETWAAFDDIESVAGCFPGAVVTSVEGDTFQGSCKVKLGPIALVYNGSGTFLDKDEAAHSMRVEAKGKDKRGNGTAGANVTATMTGNGASTEVVVVTDLNITGKPAQFGRGVMQDVSDKLLGRFVACLEQRLGGDPAGSDPAGPSGSGAAGMGTAASAPPASGPDAEPASRPTGAAAVEVAEGEDPDSGPASAPMEATTSSRTPPRLRPAAPAPSQSDDALDLGAAVVPVLIKTYWKQALAAVLVVALFRRLVSRR